MKNTPEQQLQFLARDVLPLLTAVVDSFYDPGYPDMDEEQRIGVSLTLGDYRRAARLKHELERMT